MDVFEILKQDHKKVSDFFERIESASGQTKKNLFSQLRNELDLHARLEERLFYPRLENTQAAREITLEAYEEHKVVKDLLAELSNGSVDEEWDAKLTVLKENVDHHVEEEEGELFDKAKDVLSDDEAEEIGAQIEREKKSATAGDKGRGSAVNKRGKSKAASNSGNKTRSAGGSRKSGGVLKRLANFIGLGGETSEGKSAKGRGSSGSSKSSKNKATKKTASKTGSKKSAKGLAVAKKSSRKAAGGSKKKSTKSVGSRKGGAKKKRGRSR